MPARAKSPAAASRAKSPAAASRAKSPASRSAAATHEIVSSPSPRRAAASPSKSSSTSSSTAIVPAAAVSIPNKSGDPKVIIEKHSKDVVPPAFYPWKVPHMPHQWISVWMLINVIVVIWDLTYVLLRPYSMHNQPGAGRFSWIWAPYETYGKVDGLYGRAGFLDEQAGKDHWNQTQSILNAVEVLGGLIFLWLCNFNDARANPVGIVVSTCTLWKTVIYFTLEHLSGYVYTGHNAPFDFWFLYILPSSVWIILPLLVILDLSGQSVEKLDPST